MSSPKPEILHFDGFFLSKSYKVSAKKVPKSYISWHCRVIQSLRKTDLWFQIWHEEFGEFSCEHWQVWKFALWCATFVESILCLSQKRTEKLCAITPKNDANFEDELTCALKNDMRNLATFDSTLKSLKICTLMGSFWAKYTIFKLKSYRGVLFHDTEIWCNT